MSHCKSPTNQSTSDEELLHQRRDAHRMSRNHGFVEWLEFGHSGALIPGYSHRCRVPLGTRYELRIRKAYCASLRRTRVQHLYHFVRAVVGAFSDLVPEYSFEHFEQHWYRPRCLLDAHRASLP